MKDLGLEFNEYALTVINDQEHEFARPVQRSGVFGITKVFENYQLFIEDDQQYFLKMTLTEDGVNRLRSLISWFKRAYIDPPEVWATIRQMERYENHDPEFPFAIDFISTKDKTICNAVITIANVMDEGSEITFHIAWLDDLIKVLDIW